METSEIDKSDTNPRKKESASSPAKPTRGMKPKRGRGRPKLNKTIESDDANVNGSQTVASLKHVGKFRYLSSLTQPDSETSETEPEVVRGRGRGKGRGRGRGRGRGTANRVIPSNSLKLNEPAVSRSGRRIKPNSRWAPDSDFDPGPIKNSRTNSKSKVTEKVTLDSDRNEPEQQEATPNGTERVKEESKEVKKENVRMEKENEESGEVKGTEESEELMEEQVSEDKEAENEKEVSGDEEEEKEKQSSEGEETKENEEIVCAEELVSRTCSDGISDDAGLPIVEQDLEVVTSTEIQNITEDHGIEMPVTSQPDLTISTILTR